MSAPAPAVEPDKLVEEFQARLPYALDAFQVDAILALARGHSVLVAAPTGTGKTLAYLLPLFNRIDAGLAATQVIIVAPTHELAIQIHRQSCELAQNAKRAIRSVLLIGGTPTDRQIEKLKGKPQVVVGSPGRIVELIGRGIAPLIE